MVPERDKTPIPFLWWLAAPPNHSCDVPEDSPETHPAASSHHHGVNSAAHGPPATNGASPWPALHESNPTAPAKLSRAHAAALLAPVHPATGSLAPCHPSYPTQPLLPEPPCPSVPHAASVLHVSWPASGSLARNRQDQTGRSGLKDQKMNYFQNDTGTQQFVPALTLLSKFCN